MDEIHVDVESVVGGVEKIDYCWVTRSSGDEKKWLYPVKAKRITIKVEVSEFKKKENGESVDYKVTAYGWKREEYDKKSGRVLKGYFQNCGTAIFRLVRTSISGTNGSKSF